MPNHEAGWLSELVHTRGESCDVLTVREVVAASRFGQPHETRIGMHIGFDRRSTDVLTKRFGNQKMPQTLKKGATLKAAAGVAPRIYSFSLILQGASELTPEIADALYESGCDDALVGSRDGVLFSDF